MADRDSGARRALPGEGTGMSGVVGLAEQLAVAVKALEEIAVLPRTRRLREGAWEIVSVGEATEIAHTAIATLREAA